mmetsp:Transcript_53626/g.96367  ORF Transcript_53626/g.96367 Transcript_53626/m.96367 type:complete len:452 (-) Transcript_53626:76-1431(-)
MVDASETSSSEEPLRRGTKVRIQGLQSAAGAQLNGTVGSCLDFNSSTGRWGVRLSDGTSKALKPENLAAVVVESKKTEQRSQEPSGRKLPDPPATGTKFQVSGVLSTHIGDDFRLKRLGYCFNSIKQQTRRLAAFFVVWSAPERIASEVEALLEDLRSAISPTPVLALRQTKKTSQFYDIRWLYNELIVKEPRETWLIFTDDDDLWGPERVRSYLTVISQHAPSAGVTAICAQHKVRPSHRDKVANSVEEVQRQLASGAASHCGGVHWTEEFFDFACPSWQLGAFLATCNDDTLLHQFADLRFTRFMSEYYEGGKVIYFPTDQADRWTYYYSTAFRRPEDQEAFDQFEAQNQASTVVTTRPEDKEEALQVHLEMSMGKAPSREELESMTEFVSGLRQNIDAMLIRHFPEDPMKTGEMKRIAIGQIQGQAWAGRLAQKLALQSCKRFGIRLV